MNECLLVERNLLYIKCHTHLINLTNTILAIPAIDKKPVSLHDLISAVLPAVNPTAACNSSTFVNDTARNIPLKTDQVLLAAVVGGLLSAIATHAKDYCIRLQSKLYGNIVLLYFDTPANTVSIELEVSKLQPFAERLTASISVNKFNTGCARLIFGFANLPVP
jgi:hypothetical protein